MLRQVLACQRTCSGARSAHRPRMKRVSLPFRPSGQGFPSQTGRARCPHSGQNPTSPAAARQSPSIKTSTAHAPSIGDEPRGLADPEAEPAERRQLQGRGRKRRVGWPVQGVALDGDRPEPRLPDAPYRVVCAMFRREARLPDIGSFQPGQRRGEGTAVLRRRFRLHGPVLPRHEGLDPALALADQAQRHRLHPARRAAARQLAPQHRRQAVAHLVVERAPRLPGLDLVHVDCAWVVQRRPDRLFRHLVEGGALDPPAADRVPFLQPVQHLPGDRLALPVRVRGEDQPIGILQRPGDRAERPGRLPPGLVDHRETVPGIHRTRPGRQVADVAAGRHHPA